MKRVYLYILFLIPQFALASGWQNLWYTPDQQAAKLFTQGKVGAAANTFHDPLWKGTAFYRSGQYQQALKEFNKSSTPLANYNRGNTLAHLGQLHEAITAYDAALKQDPQLKDALYNKKLIEQALKQKPPKQDQKNNPDQNNKNQNKNKNQDQDQKQDQQQNNSANQKQPQQQSSAQNQSQQQKQNQNPQNQQNSPQNSPPSQPQQPSPSASKPQQQTQQQQQAQQQSQQQNKPSHTTANPQQQPSKQSEAKQWMQQIPDDPGGLLRQKFLRDHLRLQGEN